MSTFLKVLVGLLIIFILGALTYQFWPSWAKFPFFEKNKKQETTQTEEQQQIVKQEQIYIQENTALTDAIQKVENSVVGISSMTGKQQYFRGSGIIITNDGLILTLANVVQTTPVVVYNGEVIAAKVMKKDSQNNLALLKIEKENLSACRFIDPTKIKMGQRVFLAGVKFNGDSFIKFVNEGIIKNFTDKLIETNIIEGKFAPGTTLFNIEGELVGINYFSEEGNIISIPIQKIKTFTGF